MKGRPLARAGSERIREMPANVMVRDYPETLALLLGRGMDLAEVGTRRVGEFAEPELIAEIKGAIDWRPQVPSPTP